MSDPYQVLGVSRDASDEEIKRAYRRLAKQYHPDANPGDAAAAKKMQEVNEAYDRIKNPEKYRQQTQQQSYDPYGQAQGGYYNPFEDWDPFFGYRQQRTSGQRYSDSHMQAAYNYIRYGRYREALNVLGSIAGRSAQWYYLSALANEGLGNQVTALEHMKRAVSMEPGNQEYMQELSRMENGGAGYRRQAGNYRGFSVGYDPCSNAILCLLCNFCCGGRCFFC